MEIVAYDTDGTALTRSKYIQSIDDAINETDEVSTDEVFRKIKSTYDLE